MENEKLLLLTGSYDLKAKQREADFIALERMKEIERSRRKKMKSVRIDQNTILTSTPKRIKALKEEYAKGYQPVIRGVAAIAAERSRKSSEAKHHRAESDVIGLNQQLP